MTVFDMFAFAIGWLVLMMVSTFFTILALGGFVVWVGEWISRVRRPRKEGEQP